MFVCTYVFHVYIEMQPNYYCSFGEYVCSYNLTEQKTKTNCAHSPFLRSYEYNVWSGYLCVWNGRRQSTSSHIVTCCPLFCIVLECFHASMRTRESNFSVCVPGCLWFFVEKIMAQNEYETTAHSAKNIVRLFHFDVFYVVLNF